MRVRRAIGRLVALGVVLVAVAAGLATGWIADPAAAREPAASPKQVARGRYLVTIMDCAGCHTGGALAGKPDPERYLAGSEIGFGIPDAGVLYPKNLTPDPETGLGRWTEAEIIAAIRQGRSRDGRQLHPIMPWPSYAALTDQDVRAAVAYLRSVKPVRFAPPRNARPGEKPPAPYLTVVDPR